MSLENIARAKKIRLGLFNAALRGIALGDQLPLLHSQLRQARLSLFDRRNRRVKVRAPLVVILTGNQLFLQ